MDWLRRNWPDLLIGIALMVVIAMIIMTLLSGGSLASLVRRDTPQPLATGGSAQTTDDSATTDGDGGSSTDTASSNQANTQSDTQTNAQANTPEGGAATTGDDYDVFVPGVPGRDAAGEAEATDTDSTDSTDSGSDASASGVQDGGIGASAGDGALPAASQSGGFRVAAGATNSRDGARALAESYREEGLEVTVERKDDLYLLWVGPYGTRADADVAAEAIIAGGGDALVYNYGGESDDAEAAEDVAAQPGDETAEGSVASDTENTVTESTGTENAATESVTQNSVATGVGNGDGTVLADNGASRTQAAGTGTTGSGTMGSVTTGADATGAGITNSGAVDNAVTASGNPAADASNGNEVAQDLAAGAGAGELYLQVGAFASDASAAPRLAQLEQLGLNVTNSEDAGGLLRLFVGPYGEAQIAQIQTRLNAQGIESFTVSQ